MSLSATPVTRVALDKLGRLFIDMAEDYDEVAGQCGFICKGCDDNCCETRFYHFTVLECLFLKQGLAALDSAAYHAVSEKARTVCARYRSADAAGETVRVMCPLNTAGRCVLYDHRPMICRLHGVPHCLRRPDGRLQVGPGCEVFALQCGGGAPAPLDRTPHYQAVATLEKQLRDGLGFYDKIRMTIAEMVLCTTLAGLSI